MALKVGDRVKLIKKEKGWNLGPMNPLVGTEYECTGVVTRCNDIDDIWVRWDNCPTPNSSYKEGVHLQLYIIDSRAAECIL